MKKLAYVSVILAGLLLVAITADFPAWGDPDSPAATHVAKHYIEHTLEDTGVPNIVTSLLADYRGFDTMFETTVVFCAGAACFFILGAFACKDEEHVRHYRHKPSGVVMIIKPGGRAPRAGGDFERIDPTWVPYDFIVSRISKIMVPFIQIYGLYVIAHGHYSPGGGFQGGVILAAAFLLLALSHNMRALTRRISNKTLGIMSAGGVIIYSGYAGLAMLYGKNFLDYSAMAGLLHTSPMFARYLGILFVEIGVAVTVMSTMIIIYNNVASMGRYEEGL